MEQDVLVCMDVSKQGLGVELKQNGRLIYYACRKLRLIEENYVTGDLELDAMVHILRLWRHYFLG